jgi:hypothetical protein
MWRVFVVFLLLATDRAIIGRTQIQPPFIQGGSDGL